MGGRLGSSSWKYLIRIHRGVGSWFEDNLVWLVSDWAKTFFFFFLDQWLENGLLSKNHMVSMADMCSLGQGVREDSWMWWRKLLA